MYAMEQRVVLKSAAPSTPWKFGTPVKLHPAFRPFAQSAKSVRRRTHYSAIRAEDNIREKLDGALRSGNKIADSAADLLPDSLPRGVAKIGVVGVGGLVTLWLFQKVLSTVLFLGLLGGGAFLWLKLSSKDNDNDGNSGDALSEAKRIMDKYR